MKEKIEEAIKILAKNITKDIKSGDALHLTQSILNLVNAKRTLKDTEKD